MKRAALRFIGTSRSILLFALILITGLVAIGLWAFRALLPPPIPVLTGTYRADDGGIYYVRQTGSTNIHQLGRTIWWLGLMRDRQPMQRGTHFPIIGFEQLEPVFDFLNPPCPASNQCWAFANVFKGTITESPTQTLIEGDWAGVPQSTSA